MEGRHVGFVFRWTKSGLRMVIMLMGCCGSLHPVSRMSKNSSVVVYCAHTCGVMLMFS